MLFQLDALVRNSARMKCKVGRDSIDVKVLLFQLGALVGNSVHMKCKVARDSEVKVLLFQLGALVSNSARLMCKVARDPGRSQSFLISIGYPSFCTHEV